MRAIEGLGADRRWALPFLLCALLVVMTASQASAVSEIVDVRVGTHPGFTRVVFELDTPAGYRIERDSPDPGKSELVISINATSIPRKIQPQRQSLIGIVRVTPHGIRTVSRIELKQAGLRLKEMILTNPPRIVLDVLKPTEAKAAAKPKPKPAPIKQAEPKPAPKAAPKTAPKPVVKAKPKPAPVPVAKVEPKPAPAPKAAAAPTAKPTTPIAKPPEPERPTQGATRREVVKFGPSDELAPGQARPPAMAQKQTPGAQPPSPRPSPEEDESSSFGMIVAGGLALLMVIFGVLFVLRRRAAGDEDEPGDKQDESGFVGEPLTEDNPFAGLGSEDGSQPPLPVGGGSTPPPPATDDADLGAPPQPIEASELDFGDLTAGDSAGSEPTIEVGGTDDVSMEIGGEQTVIAGLGDDAPAGDAGLDDDMDEESEEAMRMMRELEQRIVSLESRMDELVDARERLERQVAAQTEELRVQRAAIARTQRAVRNMTRSDDDGPTEPALRDPS